MAHTDLLLVDLAAVVADGETPDWAELESTADERRRAVIGRLRTLSEIAQLHQTLTNGDPAVPAVRTLLDPGTTWGDLHILDVIGSGRFGDVYRAFDPSLEREVALKILASRDDDLDDPTVVVDEGRLAARVRHPNVVTIYGARRFDRKTGVWMELVRGRTLEAELAADGPFSTKALTQVATELGGALAAVHAAGLVHRDVKTTNVMRDADGRVVLGDFGTGRPHDTDDQARSGLAGTPAYLAPEIFDGQPARRQSDIYSLGVLLFRLATGRFPITARSLQGYRAAHETQAPATVAALRPDLSRRLTSAIDRALSPDPGDRFETATALVTAVRPRARRWPTVVAAAALAIAIPAAAWWATRQSPNAFQERAQAAKVAYRTGDLDQARLHAHGAASILTPADFRREPENASWIKVFPAMDAWLQGDAAGSLRLLNQVAQEVPTAQVSTLLQFVVHIDYMYLTLGRLEQAREMAGRLTDHPRHQAYRLQLEALVTEERGDTAGLRQLLAGRPPEELVQIGSLTLEAGLIEEWRGTDAFLRAERGLVRTNDYQGALLALAEDRTADGARLLNTVIERSDSGTSSILRASIKLAALQRADGDLPSAIETLEGASREPRWNTTRGWALGFLWIRMRAALAALYRDADRIADADAVERELRQLLAVADPDHPVRRQLDRTR